MVSGGTYGTEEIIHGAGYGHGILILLFLPVLWCLPTAFMIGELSSALPQEGGYYAWVRRGLGNFWGFQEAWLSLAASIFDMAIYPTLFVFYLKQMSPWFGLGNHGIYAGLFVVVTCAVLNLAGIRVVGITSLWLFFLLSAPFALIVVMAPLKMGRWRKLTPRRPLRGWACSAACLWQCGTTWAGITPRRLHRKSSGRRGHIRRP